MRQKAGPGTEGVRWYHRYVKTKSRPGHDAISVLRKEELFVECGYVGFQRPTPLSIYIRADLSKVWKQAPSKERMKRGSITYQTCRIVRSLIIVEEFMS